MKLMSFSLTSAYNEYSNTTRRQPLSDADSPPDSQQLPRKRCRKPSEESRAQNSQARQVTSLAGFLIAAAKNHAHMAALSAYAFDRCTYSTPAISLNLTASAPGNVRCNSHGCPVVQSAKRRTARTQAGIPGSVCMGATTTGGKA